MKICGIYKIVSPTGRIYIGQSIDCNKRFGAYKNLHCKSQPKLHASLVKYGYENHSFQIIHPCEPNEMESLEKYYVDLFQSFSNKNGLNVRDGGGNRASLSEEQKRKISATLTGKKHTPERIEKNRLSSLGKKLSEEHKRNISIGSTKPNLGKKASEETRRKQSVARKGIKTGRKVEWTAEMRQKMSGRFTGEGNPNFGKPKSEESKRKTAESLRIYHQKRIENVKNY